MKPVKKIALLHTLCSVGKASLSNMFPVLSMMGIEPCAVPTMLLSTHTGGYGIPASHSVPGEYIRSCARHFKEQGIHFDMIFIGYLGTPGIAEDIRYFVEMFPGTTVVLDPIMGDHGRYYRNFDEGYGQAIRSLLPLTDVILPNLTECFLLLQKPFCNPLHPQDLAEICGKLCGLGGKTIVITSAPVDNFLKSVAICENGSISYLKNEEHLPEFHGSGDVFDGMFTAKLLLGYSILESAKAAQQLVCRCIRESSLCEYPEREGLMLESVLNRSPHVFYSE